MPRHSHSSAIRSASGPGSPRLRASAAARSWSITTGSCHLHGRSLERAFGVLAAEDADEDAGGAGYGQAGQVLAPVGLAGDIVVGLAEAERFEPRRGSWREVSLVVVAVGDHRPPPVERARRFAVEGLERDVDR